LRNQKKTHQRAYRSMKSSIVHCAIVLMFLGACQLPSPITPSTLLPTSEAGPQQSTIFNPDIELEPTSFLPLPPTATQKPEGQQTYMSTPTKDDSLTITILYDNNPYDSRLRTAWGFAALIEHNDNTYLFDTGGDAATLLENMRILEVDPSRIQFIILSHAHADHTGGLEGLLGQGVHPTVYLPPSFSAGFKHRVSQIASVVEVLPGLSLAEDVFTTGEMGAGTREQALVIKTGKGLVIITGCAHPGVVSMVARAKELFNEPVFLVLGGFHLGDKSSAELESITAAFKELEVEKVAPCHCTGEQAIEKFKEKYSDDFIQAGVGRVIVVE